MAKSPDEPKKSKKPKDYAKPTRAKAHRPDAPAHDPALDELLNPGISKGRAGIGSGTGLTFTSPQRGEVDDAERRRVRGNSSDDQPPSPGASRRPLPTGERQKEESGLQPPPDNSFDRRADRASEHTARSSTQSGFRERPQSGYVTRTPFEGISGLDPELARELGLDAE